jgi:glycosyltransferase involved in cell wall biosynthesis
MFGPHRPWATKIRCSLGSAAATAGDGVTGFVVSPDKPEEFAAAALRLFRQASLGEDLGGRARTRAGLKYDLQNRTLLHRGDVFQACRSLQ